MSQGYEQDRCARYPPQVPTNSVSPVWQQHGPQWIATLANIAGRTSSFRLRYRRLVATNSAVITVADEPNRLSALRRELIPLLDVPGSGGAGRPA